MTLGQVVVSGKSRSVPLPGQVNDRQSVYNNTSRLSFRKLFAPQKKGLGQWWTMDQETDTANNINFPHTAPPRHSASLGLPIDGHLRALLLFYECNSMLFLFFFGTTVSLPVRSASHRRRACKSIILNKSRKAGRPDPL